MTLPAPFLDALASAAVREGLADAVFTRLSSPLGRLLVVQGPDGLVRIAFPEEAEDRVLAEVAGALGPNVIGFAVVKLIALPFGGIGNTAWFYGFLLVVVVLGVLVLVGRRRQKRARARAAEQRANQFR